MPPSPSPRRTRVRGPNDPSRAERIVDAALKVIAERGVEGLTHRAIAEEAGVPLGSTTYYYARLEDILVAAMDKASASARVGMLAWAESVAADDDLADVFTDRVMDCLNHGPDVIASYKLYVAGERYPALKEQTSIWVDFSTRFFQRFVDPELAGVLAALYEVLVQRVLFASPQITREHVHGVFAGALRLRR